MATEEFFQLLDALEQDEQQAQALESLHELVWDSAENRLEKEGRWHKEHATALRLHGGGVHVRTLVGLCVQEEVRTFTFPSTCTHLPSRLLLSPSHHLSPTFQVPAP